MNRLFLSMAATIYVVVFVAFLLLEHAGLGIGHFFYLAIALVALALGPGLGRGGRRPGDRALHGRRPPQPRAAVERDLHDLDADPARQLRRHRDAARLVRGALPHGERRAARSWHSATSSPGCRTRGRSSSRSTGASPPGTPFALLVGDLDSRPFDEDRDEALRRVSDALSRRLDPEADVARVGGDEFAVLSLCDSVEQAAQLAVQLERSLCESGSSRHLRLVCVPARGRERADALPGRRRAPLRTPRAARAARQPRAGRRLAQLRSSASSGRSRAGRRRPRPSRRR